MNNPLERTLPQAGDCERALLSALLVEPENTAKQAIEAGDGLFYKPEYEMIFKAIEEQHEHGEPINQLTVTELLKKRKQLDKIGGEATLSGLIAEFLSSSNLKYYIELLKEKASLRRLIAICGSVVNAGYDPNAEPSELIHSHESQLNDIKEFMTVKKQNLTERIREWVSVTKGDFSVTECDRELGTVTVRDKAARRKAFQRLKEDKVIEPTGTRQGWYRKVDESYELLDPTNAPIDTIDLAWPLDIQNYALTYPGNVLIIAGETNSGKTSFLLDFVRRNMTKHRIHYMSSEMCDSELRVCLERFDGIGLNDWNAEWIERSENFSDIVSPDDINIIDYLEIFEDHFKMAGRIAKIHRKLDKGIAIVAIQKPKNRDEGVGGSSTMDKCRLYLSMEYGRMKLTKVKAWGQIPRYEGYNPNGSVCDFTISHGSEFRATDKGWYQPIK